MCRSVFLRGIKATVFLILETPLLIKAQTGQGVAACCHAH